MNAKLLVVVGKTTKREVALNLPAILGRSREADITVAHPLISRRHCEISEDNGLLILRDLTSLNGTMIGGRRVEFAALLPDAEFTIGPLTFRVLYEYGGDLESIPETRYVDAAAASADAGLNQPISAGAEEEPMPAESYDESLSGDLAMPDLLALADEDPEQPLPVPPPPRMPASIAAPVGGIGPQWPPTAIDKLPRPMTDALEDPLEVDSSLQSGGHAKGSPWATKPRSVEEPQHAPTAPAEPDATSGEKTNRPSAKEKRPAASPRKMPNEGDDTDSQFGSYLNGLR